MSAHPFHKLFELRGHTHNLVDQRFAVVGQVLKRSPVLENLEDFAAAVREDVTPKAGRDLRVEVMEGSHDWASFFAPINTAISGLVSTKLEPEACHAWRMIRREDMNTYTGSARWEIEVPEDCGPYSPLLQSLLRPSPSRHRYCNLGRWTPADPANPRESPPSHEGPGPQQHWMGKGLLPIGQISFDSVLGCLHLPARRLDLSRGCPWNLASGRMPRENLPLIPRLVQFRHRSADS